MLDIKKYQAYPVDAVQVTHDNKAEIAEWCSGEYVAFSGKNNKYLRVPVGSEGEHRKIKTARVGHWVIRESDGIFRVFYPKSFVKIFGAVGEDVGSGMVIVNEQPQIVAEETVKDAD